MEHWITTKIELDFNKKEINRFLFKSYTIDSSGKTLDETEYDSESNVVCKKIYRYFDSEDIREYIEYNPFDELLERHSYFTNESGVFYRQESEFSSGQKLIKEFSFTDIGNADKAIITDEEGNITGFEVYIFDEKGQLKEEIALDSENNEISKYVKTYDENGMLKIEKQYKDGVLFTSEYFEYDENENVVKKIIKNYYDNFELVDDYLFDKNNNMIYNSSHQNGELVFENKCVYDNSNNLISEEFFELDFWQRRVIRHERLIHEIEKNN